MWEPTHQRKLIETSGIFWMPSHMLQCYVIGIASTDSNSLRKQAFFFSVAFLLDVASRSYQKCCLEVSFERKLQENLPHLLQSRRAVTPNQDKPSRFQAFMQRMFMARITGRTPYKYTCVGFFLLEVGSWIAANAGQQKLRTWQIHQVSRLTLLRFIFLISWQGRSASFLTFFNVFFSMHFAYVKPFSSLKKQHDMRTREFCRPKRIPGTLEPVLSCLGAWRHWRLEPEKSSLMFFFLLALWCCIVDESTQCPMLCMLCQCRWVFCLAWRLDGLTGWNCAKLLQFQTKKVVQDWKTLPEAWTEKLHLSRRA